VRYPFSAGDLAKLLAGAQDNAIGFLGSVRTGGVMQAIISRGASSNSFSSLPEEAARKIVQEGRRRGSGATSPDACVPGVWCGCVYVWGGPGIGCMVLFCAYVCVALCCVVGGSLVS
jgi:hypothetical protein